MRERERIREREGEREIKSKFEPFSVIVLSVPF